MKHRGLDRKTKVVMVRAQRLSIVHFVSSDLEHSKIMQSIIGFTAIIVHKFANVEICLLIKFIVVFNGMYTRFASEDLDHDQDV